MAYGDRFQSRSRDDRDLRPLEVTVLNNDVERAIKILKREIGKEGTLKALKNKRFYEKPSEVKKRKQRDALRRVRRAARRARR
ncbi:MAG: small subunit ribosomal protein S21 [Myxococcota bacterium]|jgi:small subunit ribosomal protein S21